MTYETRYAAYRQMVEDALKTAVPDAVPAPLRDAMRYSLLAGGKRLRPVLLLAAHAMIDEDVTPALPFAAAAEMIHTYSLIHDDLPAMDNDTLRRGKPTNHVVYGEAVAILAGDGLQSLAFETMLLSGHKNALPAARALALGAGVTGMIAGQSVDVTREGEAPTEPLVRYIHQNKTAQLIKAPVKAGLLLAGADEKAVSAGADFGESLGLAFQIIDDILDLTGDQALMGKTLQKDTAEGKLTWPALFGLERARADAKMYTDRAESALQGFKFNGEFLKTLARNMLSRVQ